MSCCGPDGGRGGGGRRAARRDPSRRRRRRSADPSRGACRRGRRGRGAAAEISELMSRMLDIQYTYMKTVR